jgi:ribonuclease HIII
MNLRRLSIAAASIIAKTTRDAIMTEFDYVLPGYNFATLKGTAPNLSLQAYDTYKDQSVLAAGGNANSTSGILVTSSVAVTAAACVPDVRAKNRRVHVGVAQDGVRAVTV